MPFVTLTVHSYYVMFRKIAQETVRKAVLGIWVVQKKPDKTFIALSNLLVLTLRKV